MKINKMEHVKKNSNMPHTDYFEISYTQIRESKI